MTSRSKLHASPHRSSPSPSLSSPGERIAAILEEESHQTAEDAIRALLRVGVEALDLDYGYLSRVDAALQTVTIVVTSGPNPSLETGAQHKLDASFCRRTVVSSDPFSLHHVSAQGWAEDPAYAETGVESYVSTRLLVEEELYGALCFASQSPSDSPFTDEDYALIERLGRAVEQVLAPTPSEDNTDAERTPDLEEALHTERQLLDRVFETSPSAIAILNAAGEFVQVSARAQDILGLEREAVTHRTFDDPDWHITTPGGRPIPKEDLPFSKVRDTGEAVMGMEHTIEWPDGTQRLLSISGAPLYRDGTFIGAVFHLDDVTNRRKAELSLEESEERFRGVFHNAALGIALLDDRGFFVDANPTFTEMLGFDDPEAVRDRQYRDVSHSEDVEAERPAFQDLVAGSREEYQIEKRFERRDGSSFWGHVTASVIDGPGDARVVAMVEDIDRRRKQRERLRLFRKAIEQADEAAIILEAEPRDAPGPPIAYANPAFGSLTGHDPDEAVGMPFGAVFGPESEDAVLEALWQAFSEGDRHKGETVTYRADGTPFLNHWTVAPVRDRTGTITHWASVHRDVTEQRMRGWRLIEAHDAERRRIDQEMHDQLGGLLTALQMTVDLARIEVRDENGPTDPLDNVEDRVDDLASAIRTITRRLHPKVLVDHGLTRALPSLIETLEAHHDRVIHLDADLTAEERLPSLLEATVYRIVQEVLLYALRQTEGSPLEVTVRRRARQLSVRLNCKHASLPVQAPDSERLPVLDEFRQWIDQLDGTFTATPQKDASPQIEVTLPLVVSCLPEYDADRPAHS